MVFQHEKTLLQGIAVFWWYVGYIKQLKQMLFAVYLNVFRCHLVREAGGVKLQHCVRIVRSENER